MREDTIKSSTHYSRHAVKHTLSFVSVSPQFARIFKRPSCRELTPGLIVKIKFSWRSSQAQRNIISGKL